MINAGIKRPVAASLCMWLGMVICPVDAGANGTPKMGTEVGEMYPDFVLPTLDGHWGRLSDFRGKKVLLIHFASW